MTLMLPRIGNVSNQVTLTGRRFWWVFVECSCCQAATWKVVNP